MNNLDFSFHTIYHLFNSYSNVPWEIEVDMPSSQFNIHKFFFFLKKYLILRNKNFLRIFRHLPLDEHILVNKEEKKNIVLFFSSTQLPQVQVWRKNVTKFIFNFPLFCAKKLIIHQMQNLLWIYFIYTTI